MKSSSEGSISLKLTKQFKLDWPRLLSKSRGVGARDFSKIAEEMEDSGPTLGRPVWENPGAAPPGSDKDPLKNIFGMMQKLYNSNDLMKQDISRAWAKAEEKYRKEQ